MEIKLNTRYTLAEMVIESGNTKIREDVSEMSKGGGYIIPDKNIENLITIAFEMSRFNRVSDVSFLKKLYDNFLSDSERDEFMELISTNHDRLL